MNDYNFIEKVLIVFLVLVFLIGFVVLLNGTREVPGNSLEGNCTPAYAMYENETHYISQPVSGCRDSDFSVKAVLKNDTEDEGPDTKEIQSSEELEEVKVIIQDNSTGKTRLFTYSEDDCVGACELVKGFSNRSHGMKSTNSILTSTKLVGRCGGIGERPCEVIRNDR